MIRSMMSLMKVFMIYSYSQLFAGCTCFIIFYIYVWIGSDDPVNEEIPIA